MSPSAKVDRLQFERLSAAQRPILVYFVPGNPGLVAFYQHFLAILSQNLSENDQDHRIYATSGPGFAVEAQDEEPTTLQHQIEHHWECCQDQAAGLASSDPLIVLVGHSVGAYIVLEMMQRQTGFAVVGAILLFPTIEAIAESPRGKLISPFLRVPGFIAAMGLLARLMTWCLPWVLEELVALFTGFDGPALETVLAFLHSQQGVRQALYLAADEMRTINARRWSTKLLAKRRKLYFLWGQRDGWVVDRLRDCLIQEETNAHMEMAKATIPHSFCVEQGM